jgi:hypothetical protein
MTIRMKRRILVSVTTAGAAKQSWKKQIQELSLLHIDECALFLTGLNPEEREELYSYLEEFQKSHTFSIPFVHGRSDMRAEEFEYLIENFGTKRFNLHPSREIPLQHLLPREIRKLIYIENTSSSVRPGDLKGFAGICLDIAHLEDYRRLGKEKEYQLMLKLLHSYPVGMCHISAVTRQPYIFKDGSISYAPHRINHLSELSYLRTIPRNYFGEYAVLELENPLHEQLIFKNHIEQSIWRSTRQPSINILQPSWQQLSPA